MQCEIWLCIILFDIMGGVAFWSKKNQEGLEMALASPFGFGRSAQPSPPWSPALLTSTRRHPLSLDSDGVTLAHCQTLTHRD